jgi:hypothetical protein
VAAGLATAGGTSVQNTLTSHTKTCLRKSSICFKLFIWPRVQWVWTKVHYLIPDIADFEKPFNELAFIDNYR